MTIVGHRAGEIRTRALNNIMFKLTSGLLTVSDLVHFKGLYINLLEWFNMDEVSQQMDVLNLLAQLTKVIYIS